MIFHTGFALDLRKVPDSKDTNHLLAPPLPIRWRTQRELSSDEMMTWPQGCKETGFPCDFRHHLGSNKEATAGAAVTALVTTTSTKSWAAEQLTIFSRFFVNGELGGQKERVNRKLTLKKWRTKFSKQIHI